MTGVQTLLFRSTGNIEADNINTDSITADNLTTNNITAVNITANNITADNWSPSPSVIAGILGGLPSTPDGSTSTEYGKVGTLGLFKIGYHVEPGFYEIKGNELYPIIITYEYIDELNNNTFNKNILTVQVSDTSIGDINSKWIALTATKNEQYDGHPNICLAIRYI